MTFKVLSKSKMCEFIQYAWMDPGLGLSFLQEKITYIYEY